MMIERICKILAEKTCNPAPNLAHYTIPLSTDRDVISAGRGSLLVEDRRQQVLELVKARGFIPRADLARELRVSESTVRRDLDHWEGRGLLSRIHGGAMSTE